jgi:glycosyltransferase involved in cell wall biosynthesis
VQRLRDLVSGAGLDDRLHFLGFVGGTKKISLYEAADVFVLPTSQENWGLVLTESLACRTPVITTRGVDIWRELQDSGGAVIVDFDPDALAAAIRGLLDDPEARQAMGSRARSWVLETLNPDRVIEQYYALYGSEEPVTLPGGHRQTS